MHFRDNACEHLAQYKSRVLPKSESGVFLYGGKKIPMAHILPLRLSDWNIIERYRSDFSANHAAVKRHRYFHHLNSSQALCVNLFLPLMTESLLPLFTEFLGIESVENSSAEFEKESNREVAARKTSFDFYLRQADSSEVFVEVKYTEDGFGRAKIDQEHKDKFQMTYLPLVQNSPFLSEACSNQDTFLRHYQVLRNLVHITATSHVVLLFPSANSTVSKEAVYAKDHFLTDAGKERLKIVNLEDFITFLESRCAGGVLDGYYTEVRRKYVFGSSQSLG